QPRPPIPAPAAPSHTVAHAAAAAPARAVQPVVTKPKRSLEETLATIWFPIIGVIIIVVGVGFFINLGWNRLPEWGHAVVLYLGAFSLLGGGIFFEGRDRYKNLGRMLIGGGWAVMAGATYAIANAKAFKILPSREVDLGLLLAVVTAMVLHTLKYKSQMV